MNLTSKVIFIYHIKAGRFGQSSAFESIDELRQVIKEAEYQKPFELSVSRHVQKYYPVSVPPKIATEWQALDYMLTKEENTTDELNFIVVDKVLYAPIIREILIKEYGNTLNFKSISNAKPVILYGVKSFEKPVFSGDKGEPVKRVKAIEADYRYVKDDETIIDENLNQVWPEKTDKVPPALVQLLSKTKEVIR